MGEKRKSRILAIPSVRRGNGSGHLHRMLTLAAEYPEQVSLFLDRNGDLFPGPVIDLKPYEQFIESETDFRKIPGEEWSYILLDQRETSRAVLQKLKKILPGTPIAAVDEGSRNRRFIDYLIDTMPGLHRRESNLFKPDLNPMPVQRRFYYDCPERFEKILVSFGGEDPRGLTLPSLEALLSLPFISSYSITVVQGPASRKLQLPPEVKILKAPDNLREHLSAYDCLVTSYGLTALEALAAGTPVLTINPSRYHSRLARKTGLPVCGTGKPDKRRLKRILESPRKLIGRCVLAEEALNKGTAESTSLSDLSPSDVFCPGCGRERAAVIGRFPERSFYRCRSCGLVYQQRWVPDSTVYNHAYFFDEYKRQYGKNYLDDFEHIRKMGEKRLKHIQPGHPDPALLDIGCAYGPFLQAAKEAGFRVEGVEPSREAALWAEKNLGCEVHALGLGEFTEQNPQRSWDAVTLWYVIEHFPDLQAVLKQLSGMVRPGGVLAMGTPNGKGISARRHLKSFLAASPADHYTILSPSSIRKLLAKHGFRVEKFRVPGLHRERFPAPLYFFWPLNRIIASWLLLGDTFEIYARRLESEKPGKPL
jgi:2-polyprenyl-3-methyl-5-hydroxy-6-metoxy-1,4-benzoquinol methylase/spore coat polysaccharide biosynthesis predicted glycosyltransferase SpsG